MGVAESTITTRSGDKYLPYDLLVHIFSILETERYWVFSRSNWLFTRDVLQPTLYATSLVNRTWYEASRVFLYRDVLLESTKSLTVFSRTLRKRKELRPLVRSLFFNRAFYPGDRDTSICFEDCRTLDRVFSMCTNIHSKTVRAHINSSSFLPKAILNRAQRRYNQRLRNISFETLTRLELQPFGNFPSTFTPELYLPVLQDLTIRYYSSGAGSKRQPQWPTMPRLRRLCLYQCEFLHRHISLPNPDINKVWLRALEIVGGIYLCTDLLSKIKAFGCSLELLTFFPVFSSNRPNQIEFMSLPSIVVLRISNEFFVTNSPLDYPENLTHLVISKPPYWPLDRRLTASSMVNHVRELIMYSGQPEFRPYLRTIRLGGSTARSWRAIQAQLAESAARNGIKFTLTSSLFMDTVSSRSFKEFREADVPPID